MKKSYFILQPIRPRSREKTDLVWTQEQETFVEFVDRNLNTLKAQAERLRFVWRNKQITFNKLIARCNRHAEKEWGKPICVIE